MKFHSSGQKSNFFESKRNQGPKKEFDSEHSGNGHQGSPQASNPLKRP